MGPEALAHVLQERERRFPDLGGVPQVAVKGDLPRNALRIAGRQDRTDIDAAGMGAKQAAVMTE